MSAILAASTTEDGLRRWTRGEFDRMLATDVIPEDEDVLLHDGQIYRVNERNPRLWTRSEYYRLAEAGVLSWEERVELLEGEITEKVKISPPRATARLKTAHALRAVIASDCFMCQAYALAAPPYSEMEPDVMIVRGELDDYSEAHPTPLDALLVVEVADTTLWNGRGKKARIYALARCWDYWIVNLRKRTLEVYRDPVADGYETKQFYSESEAVAPLAAPENPVRVADLLPLVRTNP